MINYLKFMLILVLLCCFTGCNAFSGIDNATPTTENTKPIVAVSIVPQYTFVSAVAGDLVQIITIIPPGMSPANYQPSPQQMQTLSEADVFFSIGIPIEESYVIPSIASYNDKVRIIPLAELVETQFPVRYFASPNNETTANSTMSKIRDPHIWLSPRRVQAMVSFIADELCSLDPAHSDIYRSNAASYHNELETLHQTISGTLKDIKQQSFLVYHPAFGYFADDYNLNMIAIEDNGKEATAKQLQQVIDLAKEKNIKFIFYQEEFDDNQAQVIASEIKGEVIKVAPLSPNYLQTLTLLADKLQQILQ